MAKHFFVGLLSCILALNQRTVLLSAEAASSDLFAKKNLVAWCIVPFDSKKRGPEERAAMLEKLGFSKFAYDYRAEHIPTFDAEIEALKRHNIELTAWWFPTSLNDEAKMTLAVFEKHQVTPQLWVTGGGAPTKNEQEQQQRVRDEAARIRPIAEAAAKVRCKVALYNHGGWFGEPENQIAIIRELNLPNVGIVYNQHHGHDHLDRFPELLMKMKPYLFTLNLNGMAKDGERKGQKILQLGEGDLDLKLLKEIRDSGYSGPIGILGHTSDDAEQRLQDNLDGLRWLLPQLDGKPAGPKPKMRTPVPVVQAIPNTPVSGTKPKIEGHWGEEALGFRWTEEDSRDDRFGQMDTGPFFSGSITGPGGIIFKGIVVRLGDQRTASICYDTELMRASAGWTGFLKFDAARYGIIVPPRIDGTTTFTTPLLGGWSRTDKFSNFRESSRYGGLPKSEAHYEGLYRHGQRVVVKFSVGTTFVGSDPVSLPAPTTVLESPWVERFEGASALTRTLWIGPSTTPLRMLVAEKPARVRVVGSERAVTIQEGSRNSQILVVPAHALGVTVKLLIAASSVNEAAFEKLAAASPAAEDLMAMTKPGPSIWGTPLETVGEVSKDSTPFAVDTITLPFDNRFNALMFCGGHGFLPDGRAFVCTLHGDVWLVDGIDDTLKRITWRRFATGLFQPLGVKLVPTTSDGVGPGSKRDLYVVGRDQITRLYDLNGDGEADHYQNFNNDAYVSLNGHEYVTSLETDRAGNFYFVKGNCDSAIPHDGSLLRVSADGTKLDVAATGFRNSNGIGIGPNDEITVAPQEGEWTPASAVFAIHEGGFYGYTPSHHGPSAPKDFERPFCWFPRLADNSCGGQVWVPTGQWGPLSNHLLHLSYGQCKLRLLLREPLTVSAQVYGNNGQDPESPPLAQRRSPLVRMNGGSTELPMTFASGIHRARFNPKDGHLYLTGLKGWVTSAVDDGCFQRVRFNRNPVDLLVGMKTYRNGVALTFTQPLNRDEVEDVDNYQLEAWNYHWSENYGSPDLKLSAPGQVGRDAVEPRSVSLLDDNRTVFIEIPNLSPADQLGISYSLRSADARTIEQTAYLTLNGIPDRKMPDSRLHRSRRDVERAELISRLSPGVVFSAPSIAMPVHSRLLAWSDHGSREATPSLTATGYLKIPATGEYRFSVESPGSKAKIELEIHGERHPVSDKPTPLRLRKGFAKIRVTASTREKSFSFRLMWESDGFPRELIPATVLFCETHHEQAATEQSNLLAGQLLFTKYQCSRCHIDNSNPPQNKVRLADVILEPQRDAPSLQGIGSRIRTEWFFAWLRNPNHLRSDATMPQLPIAKNDNSLNDLAAYLASLRDPSEQAQPAAAIVKSDDAFVERGTDLFERLGCIACHTFAATDPNPEWNRISLHFVGTKFRPGQLERYLRTPHQHHIGSHMPDFHLTDDEAKVLAAHIDKNSIGAIESRTWPAGDPDRGQKLFAESRCDRCHQVSAGKEVTSANVRSAIVSEPRNSCMAAGSGNSHNAPEFHLSAGERDCLRQYLAALAQGKSVPREAGRTVIARTLTSLRCTACHPRDSKSAIWPEIVADEGSGRLTETVPQLTWVGEKLQGPWIAKLLKGELKQKPRPWLTARMPSFPEYADLIAHGLADEHAVRYFEQVPVEFDSEQSELGRVLTLRDGGLDCRQCHGIGNEKPQGDVKTQIALGINFAMIRDRLRPGFVLRQLLDPPRYDIGSRMPRFAPDLKTTAAKHLVGGDARKQFDALKQFLYSLNLDEE